MIPHHEAGGLFSLSHPHLTALDALVCAAEEGAGAQQVWLGLGAVTLPVQASVRQQQDDGMPPVRVVRVVSQRPLRVQRGARALVPIKRCWASVHLHAGTEALVHQGPEPGPRVAAPRIRPEGNGEGLGLIHQRRQGFLRVHWRAEQRGHMKV